MKKIQIGIVISVLGMLLSGCGGGSDTDKPKLSSIYQKNLDSAWEDASKGKNPTMACASVVGTAVGMVSAKQGSKSEAVQAYEACYVDAFVHYANTYIALPDNAALDKRNQPEGCGTLFTHAMSHQRILGGFAREMGVDTKTLDEKARAGLSSGAASCKVFAQAE